MAKILIIDDNRAASAFLKLHLMYHHHQVIRRTDIKDAIDPATGVMSDIVLINHALDNDSGWHVFNILKQAAPDLPASVYVLSDLTAVNADWIVRSVDAVLAEIVAEAKTPSESLDRLESSGDT